MTQFGYIPLGFFLCFVCLWVLELVGSRRKCPTYGERFSKFHKPEEIETHEIRLPVVMSKLWFFSQRPKTNDLIWTLTWLGDLSAFGSPFLLSLPCIQLSIQALMDIRYITETLIVLSSILHRLLSFARFPAISTHTRVITAYRATLLFCIHSPLSYPSKCNPSLSLHLLYPFVSKTVSAFFLLFWWPFYHVVSAFVAASPLPRDITVARVPIVHVGSVSYHLCFDAYMGWLFHRVLIH